MDHSDIEAALARVARDLSEATEAIREKALRSGGRPASREPAPDRADRTPRSLGEHVEEPTGGGTGAERP